MVGCCGLFLDVSGIETSYYWVAALKKELVCMRVECVRARVSVHRSCPTQPLGSFFVNLLSGPPKWLLARTTNNNVVLIILGLSSRGGDFFARSPFSFKCESSHVFDDDTFSPEEQFF